MKVEVEEVDIQQFCRICFEHKIGLISCQKLLEIEDFSCRISEILSLLSTQEVEENPSYPTKICSSCKELVEATFALKIMYEKTSEVLRNMFVSDGEEIKLEFESADESLMGFDDSSQQNDDTEPDFDNDTSLCNDDVLSERQGECITLINDDIMDKSTNEECITLVNENIPNISNVKTDSQCKDMKDNTVIETSDVDWKRILRLKRKSLGNKRRRHMAKMEAQQLADQIEAEMMKTAVKAPIKIEKKIDFNHLCPICWYETTDPLEFRKHIRRKHKVFKKYLKGKPVPPNTRFVTKPRDTISIYNRSDILHWCPYCNEELPALKFGAHLWNHERYSEFHCKPCERTFDKLRDYKLHQVRSHRGEYPYKCMVCNQGFVVKYNYDCHMLKHTTKEEDLPHACKECPRKFSNPVHLWRHMHIHVGKGPYGSQYRKYKCHQCKTAFNNWKAFQAHIEICNPGQKTTTKKHPAQVGAQVHTCSLCGKIFHTNAGLKQHIMKVHEKKRLLKVCELCGFVTYNMTMHLYKHSGKKYDESRYCALCDKVIPTNYSRHFKTYHSNTEPYLCQSCGKEFIHYNSFKMHERIHIGVKRHVCPVCDKGFLEKCYLNKHMKIHERAMSRMDNRSK